jgi:hypothetical protein
MLKGPSILYSVSQEGVGLLLRRRRPDWASQTPGEGGTEPQQGGRAWSTFGIFLGRFRPRRSCHAGDSRRSGYHVSPPRHPQTPCCFRVCPATSGEVPDHLACWPPDGYFTCERLDEFPAPNHCNEAAGCHASSNPDPWSPQNKYTGGRSRDLQSDVATPITRCDCR